MPPGPERIGGQPAAQNRARYLRTVSTQMPSRRAIAAFASPSAAASTIRARSTSRCATRSARERRISSRRSRSPSTTRYGLAIAMAALPSPASIDGVRPRAVEYDRRAEDPGLDQEFAAPAPGAARPSALAAVGRRADALPRRLRLRRRRPARRSGAAAVPTALPQLRHGLGLCHLPGQPRRLRRQLPAQRLTHRQRRRSPRLRLRALPQRPHRLDVRPPTFQRRGALAAGVERWAELR